MAEGNRQVAASGPHVAPRLIPEAATHVDVVDTLTESVTADGAGTATATFNPPADAGTRVELELAVITSDSVAVPVARVYVGSITPAGLRDVSHNGDEDVAFEQPPIHAAPQQAIYVQWTGCDVGANCVATIQYRIKS